MNIREANLEDARSLLRLYSFLHKEPILLSQEDVLRIMWKCIVSRDIVKHFVLRNDSQDVSTCCISVIPNLTHGGRSYGLIENVVTDPDFRRQGFGSAILRHALEYAWQRDCYKVMLLTGSKRPETLAFYEQVGFIKGDKTGFVARPNL